MSTFGAHQIKKTELAIVIRILEREIGLPEGEIPDKTEAMQVLATKYKHMLPKALQTTWQHLADQAERIIRNGG